MNTIKHILNDLGFTEKQKRGLVEAFETFREFIIDYKITILMKELEQKFSDKLTRSLIGVYLILISTLLSVIGLFFKL